MNGLRVFSNVENISTIEPDQYAARFLEFISNAME